jgi:hypothetical protein
MLTIEAKCYRGDSQPWQLLSIMSHFQLLRQQAQKKIFTVFGILSDSKSYTFFRLDQDHKIWTSRTYDFSHEKQLIWEFIDYIIDTAEQMSPSSTRFNSEANLFQIDDGYKKYLERFQVSTPQATFFDMDALCDGMKLLFSN